MAPRLSIFIPALAASCLVGAQFAYGCPFCHSETGEAVRAGIFDEDFLVNLGLTILPFPFLGGIVALVSWRPGGANEPEGSG